MKTLLTILALCKQPDKQKHFIAGAAISSSSYLITKNKYFSVGLGVSIGAGKEILDGYGHGHRDVKDFIFTGLGSTIIIPIR